MTSTYLWLRMLLKFIVLAVFLVPIVIRSGNMNKEILKDLKHPETIDEEEKIEDQKYEENLERPESIDEEKKTEKRSGLTLINTVTFTSEAHIIAKFRN